MKKIWFCTNNIQEYGELINVPGAIPETKMYVHNNKPSSLLELRYEEMVIVKDKMTKIVKNSKEIVFNVKINDQKIALEFCRFLFSPGIKHLLRNDTMSEIISYNEVSKILFRKSGLHFDSLNSRKYNGFEGVVFPEILKSYNLKPTVSSKRNSDFLIKRSVVVREYFQYSNYYIEELIGVNGEYEVLKMTKMPDINIKWKFFDASDEV